MKKNLLTAVCGMLLVAFATAQVPESLNYQAVARNAAGAPLVNSSVAVRISIRDSSATGTVVYAERQAATTNSFGLFSCAIGTGNVISGTFAGIDWATGTKFMQVELDPTGGSSYTDMGTTQLLSVPYALHARTAYIADTVLHSAVTPVVETDPKVGSLTDNYVPVWSGSSLTNSSIYQLAGYYIGIGNTNPSCLLANTTNNVYGSDGLGIANRSFAWENTSIGYVAGLYNSLDDAWGDGLTVKVTNAGATVLDLSTTTAQVMTVKGSGNVGIGTATPAAKLDIAGSIKITDGTEGAGKLLVSDANGLASWQSVAVGSNSYTNFTHDRFYISTSTGSPYTNISTGGSSVLIIAAGAPSNGFIDGFQHDGPDEIVIYNNNATNWTIRPGQSTPSVPFYTGPGASNYVIAPGKSVRIFYEPTSAKWWVLDGN